MSSSSSLPSPSFPVGASVLLTGLVKGADLNGSRGVVRSRPDPSTGRQRIFVSSAGNKTVAAKPANLRYVPRDLSSLTVAEAKGLLRVARGLDKSASTLAEEELSGLDRDELRSMAGEVAKDGDPERIAELVARANEPEELAKNSDGGSGSGSGNGAGAGVPSFDSSDLRQGAERMSQMTPDDLRRQAAAMRAMGPAALRRSNPYMAQMTDAQIEMVLAQAEAAARDPDQLRMATDRMKGMSEGELERTMGQAAGTGMGTAGPSTAAAGTSAPVGAAAARAANVSKSQFQAATRQMSSMTPEQLRQQAATLKSMPFDALRKANPQMANMTDEQIQMSIRQLEAMADNPAMMKMAADQMKDMSEEQFDSMKGMMGGGGGGTGIAGGGTASTTAAADGGGGAAAATGGLPTDPSKAMEALFRDPEQLKAMVKTMKQNPDALKQILTSQMGEGKSDAQKAQVAKAVESFAEMDDATLDKYLRMANGAQRLARPFVGAYEKAKKTLGASHRTMAVLINLAVLMWFVLLARWWSSRGGDVGIAEEDVLTRVQEELPEVGGHDESEF